MNFLMKVELMIKVSLILFVTSTLIGCSSVHIHDVKDTTVVIETEQALRHDDCSVVPSLIKEKLTK